MIVYSERRGRRVAYIDRAEYEFRPGIDDWGRFVITLHAATGDEIGHLRSGKLRFRLREGATEEDTRSMAEHFALVFEDVQMMWVDGPNGGPPVPVVVPIQRAA